MTTSTWLPGFKGVDAGRMRLFCFPFAGGGPSAFKGFRQQLASLQVCPVGIPGREARILEPPHRRLDTLVPAVEAALLPILRQGPFAFYGHSLGAKVAFELARSLARRGGPLPARLLVSSSPAPTRARSRPPIHHLDDPSFIEELRKLNGTPNVVFEDQELITLLLPQLRADFTASETYQFAPGPPLPCPISVFGGRADPDVSEADLEAWREQTSGRFSCELFEGDHFFFQQQLGPFCNALLGALGLPREL